jgi:hypothetical protein
MLSSRMLSRSTSSFPSSSEQILDPMRSFPEGWMPYLLMIGFNVFWGCVTGGCQSLNARLLGRWSRPHQAIKIIHVTQIN